jgi:hypothetical protein
LNILSQMQSGDSATWDDEPTYDNLGNLIDSTWTLKYAIRQNEIALALTSVAHGSGWRTSITKANTALFKPTVAYWQAYAEKGSERISLGSGQILFHPNIADAGAGPFDGRTQSQKDLDAVRSAMRAKIANGAVAEYSIGNRSLRNMDLGELRAYESQLQARVNRELKADKIKNGLGNPSNIYVRFDK